jgi:hypothetical protein
MFSILLAIFLWIPKKTNKLKTKTKTIKHWKNLRLLMCNHWLWYEQISVNNTGDGYVNTFLIEDLFQYFTKKNESEIVYMLLILFITTLWEYKKQLLNRGQSNARKSFFRFTIFFFLRYHFLDMYVNREANELLYFFHTNTLLRMT